MKIGFDVISDLNLDADDEFDWEGKATSLYLIIAGNLSDDLRVIHQTLSHLSKHYYCIFYVPGSLEYNSMHFIRQRNREITQICDNLGNVTFLFKNVAIINGVAVLGCNGWYGNRLEEASSIEHIHLNSQNIEDVQYLKLSIEKLQLHLDVQRIVLITHSAPSSELFFHEEPTNLSEFIPPDLALMSDTEQKVSHWVYGSYHKNVDTTISNINYINNSCFYKDPYWPKRIEI